MTLLMAGIRMFLHQTVRPSIAHQTFYQHEMDWLAIEVTLDPDFKKFSEQKPLPVWALYGGHSADACKAPLPSEQNAVKSTKLLEKRARIADICQWECPSTEMAQNLAISIESVANVWLPESTVQEFQWCVVVDLGERKEKPTFCLAYSSKRKRWEFRKEERQRLESALSLWLYYDKSVRSKRFTKNFERSLLLLGLSQNSDVLFKVLQQRMGKGAMAKLCFVKPFLQTDANEGEDDDYNEDYEEEESVFSKPEKKSCKRNRIVGIYNGGGLQSPTFYQENTATGQDRELVVKLIRPRLHTFRSAGRYPTTLNNYIPGALSTMNLVQLYAQHIFLAFAWAFVDKFQSDLRVPKNAFEEDSLEDLEQLASRVELTHLGDIQDIILCLLSPLIHFGVLGMERMIADPEALRPWVSQTRENPTSRS
ncbi:hypothetical protein Asppvi_009011 [Aspergillus pseudoviridinutans]|uniref:Uncharacterized protein n=1 Tax=Aspergillus pseudoviridinutans TaxID=1517512 RepID=A0A9P3BEV1_9EURO|nr:uncharacterized protein Asppvi_009011 [Aspergillus pseudoviridinutans]GIJ90062.1 hypothetical protein Asppvi_009011 [Aspergillus pseudoviridinutans]